MGCIALQSEGTPRALCYVQSQSSEQKQICKIIKANGPCSSETVNKELPDPQQAPEPLDNGSAFPLQCFKLRLAVAEIIPGKGNLWQMGSADFPDDGILNVQIGVTGTSHSPSIMLFFYAKIICL